MLAIASGLLALAVGGVAGAREAEPEGPERLLRFADGLLQSGEHYRAITEYLRFASYYPGDPRSAEMPLRIGLAYLHGGRPEQALGALAPALGSELPEIRRRAVYLKGRAYYEADEMELALSSWKELDEGSATGLARRGVLFSLLRLGRRQQALELLGRPGAAGFDGPVAQGLAERLAAAPAPRRRSPAAAAVLSALLPGAGQLYAGRGRDAMVAFLINGLFVLGAVQSFRSGNEATGVLLASVEAGWYAGNIVSAASSARRSNELALERFLEGSVGLPALEAELRAHETRLLLGIRIGF